MLPATSTTLVRRMRDYGETSRFSAEARRYVRSEWNGDGVAVLMETARAGRETPAPNPSLWAVRALRRVAGFAESLATAFATPS